MELFLTKLVGFVVAFPMILLLIYLAIYPEEGISKARIWEITGEYKEPSEGMVRLVRIVAISILIIIGFILIFS